MINPTTRKPRVFISHSSRRRTAEELREGDTPNRHHYRKEFLGFLLDRLESAIGDAGFEVWVDRSQIAAGEEFEQKLSFALYTCDIGIILIDLDALDSAYVRKESTILMWRHQMDGIWTIPVLLSGVNATDLAGSHLGPAPVGLSSLSLLSAPSSKLNRQAAEELADLITGELTKGAKLPERDSPSTRWIQDFVELTSGVSVERLWRVAEPLGVDRAEWQRAREPHAMVAAAMLGADLHSVYKALVQLMSLVDEEKARAKTVQRALPLWVDLDAAKIVVDVGALPADQRVLAIATPAYRLGRHVIERGTFSAPEYATLPVPDPVGEEPFAELLHRYETTLRRTLHFFGDDTSETFASELDALGGRVFTLMRCEHLDPTTTVRLLEALRKRLPGIVYVLLGRGESNVWRKVEAPMVYRSPRADWERSARRYVSRMASLVGEEIAVESDD
ncbi:toll/interleukin-1 receptor domain-containing protein [Streptomyces sp. NPDC001796]|uniref:toll/interleukin-1 receptor domain-containing protein n=1 Tax=Streptomyces sp. NPDC001796 TaxID=3364609 RepID=UPI00369E4699